MRIAVGADHAGFDLKQHVVETLRELGHETLDKGTHSNAAVDYPDYADAVGSAVVHGEADRGIRGGLCHDTYSAHQGVEHDDVNVLVLGARVLGPALVDELVAAFLGARFTEANRHLRRLAKVHALEERFAARLRELEGDDD